MTARETPDELTLMNYPSPLWRYGMLYQWSPVYDCWLEHGKAITVKPNVHPRDALEAMLDAHKLSNAGGDYALFEPTEG